MRFYTGNKEYVISEFASLFPQNKDLIDTLDSRGTFINIPHAEFENKTVMLIYDEIYGSFSIEIIDEETDDYTKIKGKNLILSQNEMEYIAKYLN